MAVQTISIQLPDEIYQRLRRVAAATNQPLEEVAFQSIRGNLPLSLDDLAPDLRDLVADLPALDDDALWAIVSEPLPPQQARRAQHLLRKVCDKMLTAAEQAELAALRNLTDRYVLRRSYALALLKWRGQAVQLPAE